MTDFAQFFIKEIGKGVIELTCTGIVNILKYVPGVLGVDDAVRPWSLAFIPDELEALKICEKSVFFNPYALEFVPDHFKTKRMCEWAVEDEPEALKFVPDHFKTKRMCKWAVEDEAEAL